MNNLKTFILMGILTFIFLIIGNAVGGNNGIIIAFILALMMNFFSYWFSDKIVLSMYGAQEFDRNSQVYHIVEKLSKNSGLPMPKVYIVNEAQPNAFATGRNPNHSAVVVTRGLIEIMNENELSGVIGHELGHIHNHDILISTLAATMAGAITFLANMAKWAAIFGSHNDDENNSNPFALIGVAIFAPIAALLVQMCISRTREYKADEFGGRITGNPNYLADALEKLELYSQKISMVNVSPATENMFIVSPLAGTKLANLFSTHPSTKDRIKRLRNLI